MNKFMQKILLLIKKNGAKYSNIEAADISKKLYIHREHILQFVLMLGIFILGIWRIYEINQPIIFSDEYGYWANSSYFLGQDWSSLTSKIGYYSYGYSLLLVIIRVIQRVFDLHWSEMYELGILLNALMLVLGYLMAVKISKRYFDKYNWIRRNIVCFVAFLYSSNIFYAHLTMTETTIYFCFWLFLYLVMKSIDKPSVANHMLLALVSVYVFAVHQRTIAILITAIIIVIYQKILRNNRLIDVVAFWLTMTVCLVINSVIKSDLQQSFYLASGHLTSNQIFEKIFSTKNLLLVVAGIALFIFLYLLEKRKYKIVISAVVLIAMAVVMVLLKEGLPDIQSTQNVDSRISNNDFSGQWAKIKGIFSTQGIVRLGISITGKWFYMASTTGLVICWGIKDIFKHMFWMVYETIKCAILALVGKEYKGHKALGIKLKEDIWLLAVFFAYIGTFLICAIYKEGLYKVDDLVHGRYNEFLMGIMIIYSFYSLYKDKHWIRTLLISIALYCIAGAICQYTFDELQRTEFELCHSPMFGRVFWNYESPTGKVRIMAKYVLSLGVPFILLLKVYSNKKCGLNIRNIKITPSKIAIIRCVIALLIPAVSWTYLSTRLIDKYIVAVNVKNSNVAPEITKWIDLLDWKDDKNIYYFEDTEYYRYAESLQFMLPDKVITITSSSNVSLDEDAFFIMDTQYALSPHIQEKCEIIVKKNHFSLLINRNQELMERWDKD